MKPRPVGPGQPGATVLAVLLIFAAVLLVALAAINTLAAFRSNDARRGWEETLGSFDEIMQRYPATASNASALELERIAAALGINLAPRPRGGLLPGDATHPGMGNRPRPTKEQNEAFHRMQKEVFGNYAIAQVERPRRGEVDDPPPALVEYVDAHQNELAALKRHLLTEDVPMWETDLSRLSEAPVPNLLGHLHLQKLLSSLALARVHEGDREGALEYMEGSIRLAASLRDSPLVINQLVLIASTRIQLGALRHVPDLPEVWIEHLEEYDFREAFLRAMKYEGWVLLHLGHSTIWNMRERWWHRVTAPALGPYTRYCAADLSDAWRERLLNLERVDALCDRDLSADDADLEIPIPRWNRIGMMLVPNLANAVDRVARLELDVELTILVVEADAALRANGGQWPAALERSRRSTACPDDMWRYAPTAGGLTIAFPRDIGWPEQKGAILPVSVVMD